MIAVEVAVVAAIAVTATAAVIVVILHKSLKIYPAITISWVIRASINFIWTSRNAASTSCTSLIRHWQAPRMINPQLIRLTELASPVRNRATIHTRKWMSTIPTTVTIMLASHHLWVSPRLSNEARTSRTPRVSRNSRIVRCSVRKPSSSEIGKKN